MKAYVITSGEYSDYQIKAVCLDKDKAEQICATINDGLIRAKLYGDTASIEEYDTDEYELDSDYWKLASSLGRCTADIRRSLELICSNCKSSDQHNYSFYK